MEEEVGVLTTSVPGGSFSCTFVSEPGGACLELGRSQDWGRYHAGSLTPTSGKCGKGKRWGEGCPFDVKIHTDPSPAQMRAMSPYSLEGDSPPAKTGTSVVPVG